nr:hypothetical protein [Cytophagales bacterium]
MGAIPRHPNRPDPPTPDGVEPDVHNGVESAILENHSLPRADGRGDDVMGVDTLAAGPCSTRLGVAGVVTHRRSPGCNAGLLLLKPYRLR